MTPMLVCPVLYITAICLVVNYNRYSMFSARLDATRSSCECLKIAKCRSDGWRSRGDGWLALFMRLFKK